MKAGLFVPDAIVAPAAASTKGKKGAAAAKRPVATKKTPATLTAFVVNDMAFGNQEWYGGLIAGGVLVSKDRGTTWKSAGSDLFVKQPAQSLEVSADGSQVWAISQKNLLYSADKGATWNAKELAFAGAGNLKLHRLDDNNLFLTSNMGLYTSDDAGPQLDVARMCVNCNFRMIMETATRWWSHCRNTACWRRLMPANRGSA